MFPTRASVDARAARENSAASIAWLLLADRCVRPVSDLHVVAHRYTVLDFVAQLFKPPDAQPRSRRRTTVRPRASLVKLKHLGGLDRKRALGDQQQPAARQLGCEELAVEVTARRAIVESVARAGVPRQPEPRAERRSALRGQGPRARASAKDGPRPLPKLSARKRHHLVRLHAL